MRLSQEQIRSLKRRVADEAGTTALLRLLGSRLDDNTRGGEVALPCERPAPAAEPALLAARLAARAGRAMGARKVDIVLGAPDLELTRLR